MKQNLLITLADINYIQQAKQLFSSVYWNAGWKGDYMLLAHKIPEQELKWFRDKGILIKECMPLNDTVVGRNYNPVVLDKLYIFSTEFKKWSNVIFIDSDIIVRGPLDRLLKIKGFGAIDSTLKLADQFSSKINQHSEIEKKVNLNKKSFNAGVMAFSTNIIQEFTLKKLTGLYEEYKNDIFFPEEAILNLFFYKKWIKLSRVFDLYVPVLMIHKFTHDKIKALALHFIRISGYDNLKPWDPENSFYNEWTSNLKKAELIDLSKIQEAKKWTSLNFHYYTLFYDLYFLYIFHFFKPVQCIKNALIFIVHLPDKMIGLVGILIKRLSPGLYFKIRSILKIKKKI